MRKTRNNNLVLTRTFPILMHKLIGMDQGLDHVHCTYTGITAEYELWTKSEL